MLENVKVINATTGETTTFDSNDFTYTITCTSDGVACQGMENKKRLSLKDEILVGNRIEAGVTHTYSLTITYEETGVDQSSDINKTLEAKINIENFISKNPYKDNTNSLAYNIINNAALKKDGTSLEVIPLTTPAVRANSNNESILTITHEDFGMSYYFRGNVQNNFVNFNNMCWKIVRIENDGAVKLVLEDQDEICAISDGNWKIDNSYHGYDYGANTNYRYLANYLNGDDSSMQVSLEKFLTDKNIDTRKLKKDKWCLGNLTDAYHYSSGTLLTDTANELKKNQEQPFIYEAYKRLKGIGQTASATLRCDGKHDETFEAYIGALTADEIVFVGKTSSASNRSFENYISTGYDENGINTITLATFGYYFQEMSEYTYLELNGYVVSNLKTSPSSSYARPFAQILYSHNVRPVITLTPDITISSGNGTKSNPYVVN